MRKRIVLLTMFISVSSLCSAPNLSEVLSAISKKTSISNLRRYEQVREYLRWKEAMGLSESSGDWTKYNDDGCIGRYQFTITTLEWLGYSGITFERFKTNPEIFPRELQEGAMSALMQFNLISLKSFEPFLGKTVDGVLITRSGLLAAAHLGGIGAVKAFLYNNDNKIDRFGTSVKDYIQKFQGYNI